jgi:DNA-directed RNA polymerase subunit N (RpoN/RPB10)
MQQVKCQKEYRQQVKCYPCNKPNGMTHEEYMYVQQAKCYTCNKPSVMTHEEYMQQVKVSIRIYVQPSANHAITQMS